MGRILIGDMRSFAYLLVNDFESVTSGGFEDNWKSAELKVMCKLVGKTVTRTLESGSVIYVSNYTMYCYANPALMKAIDKCNKWIIDGEVYTINGYDKLDNNSYYIAFNLNKDGSI